MRVTEQGLRRGWGRVLAPGGGFVKFLFVYNIRILKAVQNGLGQNPRAADHAFMADRAAGAGGVLPAVQGGTYGETGGKELQQGDQVHHIAHIGGAILVQ